MSIDGETRVSDLYCREPGVRDAAVANLIAIGEPAVKPLVQALKNLSVNPFSTRDADFYSGYRPILDKAAAEAAEKALIGIGAPAVRPLIGLLYDTDKEARERAVRVLNRIGQPAVASLARVVRNEDAEMRAAAAFALAGIEDEQAVETAVGPLIELLHSKKKSLREEVAQILRPQA